MKTDNSHSYSANSGCPNISKLSFENNKKRNKYRMLGTELKRKAVHMALKEGPRYSSMHYKVPLESLKRWMKVGCERKKGGGRKTKDPEMEKDLY